MYSFYGGQKGQDFRIAHVFSNRSEDLLKDLQARWYSPINVGDYVFINYGDISALNKISTNDNGETIEIQTTYNKNLNIDLLNCGKSYTNSIWQKIYVDEGHNVSPDFPNSEENSFIFINFEETLVKKGANPDENGNTYYFVTVEENGETRNQITDKDGNWLNKNGDIIRLRQIPGQSLRETSDIYTEENFGFGYRLIACVTGQTPRIQVYHQTINIEDGDPYVTLDLTNPDRPELKFYQQRAQRIENVFTNTLPPMGYPYVKMITDGSKYIIDNEEYTATLTNPILQLGIPKAVQYFSGILFDQGDLIDYPYNSTGNAIYNNSKIYNLEQITTIRVKEIAGLLTASFKQSINSSMISNATEIDIQKLKNDIRNRIFIKEEDEQYRYKNIQGYYFRTKKDDKDIDDISTYQVNLYTALSQLITTDEIVDNLPWGQYGLDQETIIFETGKPNPYSVYFNNINQIIETLTGEKDFNNILLDNLQLIDNLDSLEIPREWSNFGFLNNNDFNNLDLEQKKNFCNLYIKGYLESENLILLSNLLKNYSSLIRLDNLLIDINNSKEEKYYLKNGVNKYLSYYLGVLSYLARVFEEVANAYYPGDIYINTMTGRLYQFLQSNNLSLLKVKYLGTLTAPAPSVRSYSIPAYDENKNQNTITIKNNLLLNESEKAYREEYIFQIPNPVKIEAEVERIKNLDEIRVEKEIKDQSTDLFKFYLPEAIHFYSPGWPNDESTFIDGIPNVNDNHLSIGDYFINTTKDLFDENRGAVYIFKGFNELNEQQWELKGSLRGPVGTPNIKKTLTFYSVSEQPLNDISQKYNTWHKIIETDLEDYNYQEGLIVLAKTMGIPTQIEDFEATALIANFYNQDQNLIGKSYGVYNHSYTITQLDNMLALNITVSDSTFDPYPDAKYISFNFYTENDTNEEGMLVSNDFSEYYINKDYKLILEELLLQLDINKIGIPKANNGEMYQLNIVNQHHKIENDIIPSIDSSYWLQYDNINNKWYATLMTGQGSSLSNNKITNIVEGKTISYTANYINDLEKQIYSNLTWDTENYY